MTAIGACAGSSGREALGQAAIALVTPGVRCGSATPTVLADEHCALVAAQTDWEPELFGVTAAVTRTGRYMIALDGSLYYRETLRRALSDAGVTEPASADHELIAQAASVWGARCIEHLEGDFAFLIWDATRRELMSGRDHVGRRPLFYALTSGGVVIASRARSVAQHDQVQASLNLSAVVASLSALLGGSNETGFEGVLSVPAATTMVWSASTGMREAARWRPPEFRVSGKPDLVGGGEALRELIIHATAERLVGDPVAIWLSGGADSPAVLAGACLAMERGLVAARRVLPITVSYPEGDMGREDHFVARIAERFGLGVTWVESDSLGLFGDSAAWAAHRDDPHAHTFEAMNRGLSQRARALGARVALDGYGGDQLFGISKSYLADYVARGQFGEVRSELAAYGEKGARAWVRHGLLPWLPERTRYWLSRTRGHTDEESTWQSQAPWIVPEWRRHPEVLRRLRREPPRRLLESPSAYESRWYVETPYFPRAISWASGIALDEGIELRSPLLDRRILEFAASRPVSERGIAGRPKPLLRQAMTGVLPDEVIAPRTMKTGTPGGQFQRRMIAEAPGVAQALGKPSDWRLARLGLVDVPLMLTFLERTGSLSHLHYVQLYLSLAGEVWLRQFPWYSIDKTSAGH